jgi:capsular polysaccharide export protein
MYDIDDSNNTAVLIATSRAVATLPGLSCLLGAPVRHRWTVRNRAACGGIIAWGYKPSAAVAASFAKRHALKLLRLEDGFLRSVAVGSREPPLSVVLDDIGIYYDALTPSRLEILIAEPLTEDRRLRARSLMAAWRVARVSKYNYARDYTPALPERYILAVDQVRGDASIRYGLADAASFQRMLEAALTENPECTVLLKIHPEVMSGRRQGHFDLAGLARNTRVMLLAEDVHPVTLIEQAEAVYCVTSQIGFEGLLWGKRVYTFGMPFYAGWGLTQDELSAPVRRKSATLENLVYAALIAYPRYIDPETAVRCEPERLIEWMGLQRKLRERFPAIIEASGFSLYKKPIVRRFFQGSTVFFDRSQTERSAQAAHAVWSRQPAPFPQLNIQVVRLEDGFIRSVGLGADLIQPLSWAMDRRGIYYDATEPSDLEHILQHTEFDKGMISRAQVLRERLVAERLTKYNTGAAVWQRPKAGGVSESDKSAPSIILVPGQVESDASLAFGAPHIRQNLELLKAVRAANPHAHIIYKPHPDVVAGLRNKGQGEDKVIEICNEIVVDVSMGSLLSQVDEVHTLTSLAGFEALLRGRKVICYGQPFYAGWGLTEDIAPLDRRTRKLALDELVAGVLILYPTYISRTTGKFTTPERALDELLIWRQSSASLLPWWRKGLRRLLRMEMKIKQAILLFSGH